MTDREDMAELYRIIGMRDRVAHEYLNLDSAVVWQVASVEAPRLRSTMITVLESLNLPFDPDSLKF